MGFRKGVVTLTHNGAQKAIQEDWYISAATQLSIGLELSCSPEPKLRIRHWGELEAPGWQQPIEWDLDWLGKDADLLQYIAFLITGPRPVMFRAVHTTRDPKPRFKYTDPSSPPLKTAQATPTTGGEPPSSNPAVPLPQLTRPPQLPGLPPLPMLPCSLAPTTLPWPILLAGVFDHFVLFRALTVYLPTCLPTHVRFRFHRKRSQR